MFLLVSRIWPPPLLSRRDAKLTRLNTRPVSAAGKEIADSPPRRAIAGRERALGTGCG